MPALREAATYLVASLAVLAAAVWILQLWRADWTVPFAYGGDANLIGAAVKTMLEQGWWTVPNPLLGAPGSTVLADFPMVDGLHFAIMKLIGTFAPGYGAVMNIFYVLTFPLTALSTVFALRWLGCSRWISVLGAVIYALLPYHFLRGEGHLFLAAYYTLPLGLVLVFEAMGLYADSSEPGDSLGYRRVARSWWFLVVAGLLVGSSGVYYAFFTCFLLAVATVYAGLDARSLQAARYGLAAIGAIVGAVVLNLMPTLVYWASAGRNAGAVSRGAGGAEVYGLKLDQMFLPVTGHRIPQLARISDAYMEGQKLIAPSNEAVFAPIGVVLSIALVGLLVWLLFGRFVSRGDLSAALDRSSVLAGAAVLLATTGGFGAIVAFVLPQIRAYGRISVVLALIALVALCLVLQEWVKRPRERGRTAWVPVAVAGIVAIAAILDMTSPGFAPQYAQASEQFASDGRFVASVENQIGSGAMVFQLPYVPFPENPLIVDMVDYSHFSGYLHSESLRWSYGAMKGRETANTLQAAAELPPSQMIARARELGFDAVWVDRFGYADRGAALERELRAVDSAPIVSSDGRLALYRLGSNTSGAESDPSIAAPVF